MNVIEKLKQKWQVRKQRKEEKDEILHQMHKDLSTCKPGSKEMEVQAAAIEKVRGKDEVKKAAWIQGGLAAVAMLAAVFVKEIFLRSNFHESLDFDRGDNIITSDSGKVIVKDAVRNR